ncbi:MAG: Uma2 family endonuclease [Chitinophagaceae bacterium]|nr:Uma2 family endonuclease [Chitinophagaceae bacterium]
MKRPSYDKVFSVEEYIRYEWTAGRPSDFIDGLLFEIPGSKDVNNEVTGNVFCILMERLINTDYQVYAHDVKVKIFGENKYYYPDLFITKEEKTDANRYIKFEPLLIVEVVSESSQVNDYVDKYIDYTKIPSLLYYIIVEPETSLITCYSKAETGEWFTTKLTKPENSIQLDALEISFTLKEVYGV